MVGAVAVSDRSIEWFGLLNGLVLIVMSPILGRVFKDSGGWWADRLSTRAVTGMVIAIGVFITLLAVLLLTNSIPVRGSGGSAAGR